VRPWPVAVAHGTEMPTREQIGLPERGAEVSPEYAAGTRAVRPRSLEDAEPMQLVAALRDCLAANALAKLDGLAVAPPPPPEIIVTADPDMVAAAEGAPWTACPFLEDAAAAGPGLIVRDDNVAGYVLIHSSVAPDPDSIRCLRINGRSMEPALTDRSIVAVDLSRRDPAQADGRVVCARTPDDGVVIKRWRRADQHVLLESDNRDHPPLILSAEDVDAGALIGQVIWAWVDLR